jgi:hypothetical protein
VSCRESCPRPGRVAAASSCGPSRRARSRSHSPGRRRLARPRRPVNHPPARPPARARAAVRGLDGRHAVPGHARRRQRDRRPPPLGRLARRPSRPALPRGPRGPRCYACAPGYGLQDGLCARCPSQTAGERDVGRVVLRGVDEQPLSRVDRLQRVARLALQALLRGIPRATRTSGQRAAIVSRRAARAVSKQSSSSSSTPQSWRPRSTIC